MDMDILNTLFGKGYKFFQGFKEGNSLDYEFSKRYGIKGDVIGITMGDTLYEMRINRKSNSVTKTFQNKKDLVLFLNDI